MDIVFLIIGLIVGVGVGYLIAGRKSAALSAQLQATREREELLNRTVEERIARERTITAERLAEQEKSFNLRLAEQQKQWEERLKLQTEEASKQIIKVRMCLCMSSNSSWFFLTAKVMEGYYLSKQISDIKGNKKDIH